MVGIMPYFWFCLQPGRPTETPILMIQLDANSFGLPVPPPPSSPPLLCQIPFLVQPIPIYPCLGQGLSDARLHTHGLIQHSTVQND